MSFPFLEPHKLSAMLPEHAMMLPTLAKLPVLELSMVAEKSPLVMVSTVCQMVCPISSCSSCSTPC